jgi:toluene monooxygenase system protein D
MSPPVTDLQWAVGPVLTPGPLTDAVVAAIRALNPEAAVVDRGAYLRVLVPRTCRLQAALVEQIGKRAFRLPADLEMIMPSFRGRLRLGEGEAVWELAGGKP